MEQNNYFDETHSLRPYTHSLPANPGTTPPANALRGKKPTAKAGYHPGEKNGKWIEIEDHRGEKGYLDGQPHTISDFGPYPNGWSKQAPDPTPEEIRQTRKAEILYRLNEIDTESIRPLRSVSSGSPSEEDISRLTALDEEAASLREELHAIEA